MSNENSLIGAIPFIKLNMETIRKCNGDTTAAMVLELIGFVLSKPENGVERDGHRWAYINYGDLEAAAGMTEKVVRRAVNGLVKMGLLVRAAVWHMGKKRVFLRITSPWCPRLFKAWLVGFLVKMDIALQAIFSDDLANDYTTTWADTSHSDMPKRADTFIGNTPEKADSTPSKRPNGYHHIQETILQEQQRTETQEQQGVVVTDLSELSGINPKTISEWVAAYGADRVSEVIREALKQPNIINLCGWIRSALKRGFTFEETQPREPDHSLENGMRYVTGEFADWINY